MKGTRVLSGEEVKALLGGLQARDRLLALSGLDFGLRVSEILSLTFGAVAGPHLYVHSSKGSDSAVFPIPDAYREAVETVRGDYLGKGIEVGPNTPLFISRNGTTMTRQAASQIIKAACAILGLEGKVNTHSFRKTFVTRIYEMTDFNIAATKRYSRHKSLANLDYYIATTNTTDLVKELNWG
jgi:integrase